MRLLPIAVACAFVAQAAAAEDACTELRAEVESASESLRACLAFGQGCGEESARKAAAEAALARCASPSPAPSAQATATAAPAGPLTAIVIEGLDATESATVLAAAREALTALRLVEDGAVRAARAFLEGELTSEKEADLRQSLGADRLAVVRVRADGNARYIAMRVTDPPRTYQRFAESTAATLEAAVQRLVADLVPPVAAVPTPTPVALAPAATPAPAASPAPTVPPPPPRPSRLSSAAIDASAFVGTKQLDRDEWAPLASQTELGLQVSIGSRWLRGAADVHYSFGSGRAAGIAIRGSTLEASVGVRGHFPLGRLRPWLGAGPSFVQVSNTAKFDDGTQTVRGSGLGFWAAGGTALRVSQRAMIGVELRYSASKPRVNDRDLSAGGIHAGMTAGIALGRL